MKIFILAAFILALIDSPAQDVVKARFPYSGGPATILVIRFDPRDTFPARRLSNASAPETMLSIRPSGSEWWMNKLIPGTCVDTIVVDSRAKTLIELWPNKVVFYDSLNYEWNKEVFPNCKPKKAF